jgi:hypothetical protein
METQRELLPWGEMIGVSLEKHRKADIPVKWQIAYLLLTPAVVYDQRSGRNWPK